MARDRFAKTSFPLVRLILLGGAITFLAAIFIQNLQPLISVFFLGQATTLIPLSLAMLVAFVSGAIAALVINSFANWLRRRAIASVRAEYEDDDDYEDEDEDDETVEYRGGNRQSSSKDSRIYSKDPVDRDQSVIDVKYVKDESFRDD
jgi:uncharacterized integral membrane protein